MPCGGFYAPPSGLHGPRSGVPPSAATSVSMSLSRVRSVVSYRVRAKKCPDFRGIGLGLGLALRGEEGLVPYSPLNLW